MGSSEDSEEGNGAVILTMPDPPTDLNNVAAITTATQIGLTWTSSTDGGSPIIDYAVSVRDPDTLVFNFAQTGILTTSTTVTGLTAGIIYKIKV